MNLPGAARPPQHQNPNIDDARRLVFVHNPKAAGTSFRAWLGLEGAIQHGFPTLNVPAPLWQAYTVVVVVRDPVERALSSYRFHTHESYEGGYLKKYPDLHSWDLAKYLDVMIGQELFVLAPQYRYCEHLLSTKRPDFLLRFENLDPTPLADRLGITDPFPFHNRNQNPKSADLDERTYGRLVQHFRMDYAAFGYRPKPFELIR